MAATTSDRKRPRQEEVTGAASSTDDFDIVTAPTSKRARTRTEDRRSLFVRSLPANTTNESLTDFFSEHFPVKHATVVLDPKTKQSRGYGFVTLADADDAKGAKDKLDKQLWEGKQIRVEIAERRHRDPKNPAPEDTIARTKKPEVQPPPKLIIRNLPWSVRTPEQLSALFRSYGKVKFADLPKNKGKLKGFGFITLRGKSNAEKAVAGVNGKEVDGRTLAVDFAVDKDTWEEKQKNEDQLAENEDEDDETSDEESSEDEDKQEGGAKVGDTQLDEDLRNFMKNHLQNLDDEDEEEDDDDEEEEGEDEKQAQAELSKPVKHMTDNSSTVFVRNLPFTTTDADLKAFFEKFGKVRYARVVMDKVSDRPAGTGFVCFMSQDDSKECVKGAPRPQQPGATGKQSGPKSILHDDSVDPDGRYTLDGRLLSVAQAVNKEQASLLSDDSMAKRREKDKRRLYLLSEGSIGKNSALYGLLSEPEIRARQASAAQRKKQVEKNPTLHLSLTRLALRNIPRNVDSKQLKDLARKAIVGFAQDVREGRREPLSKEENARDSKEIREKEQQRKAKGKGIVRQAKVVFETIQGTKVSEQSGGGKSRGYGFIEYTTHHWALMGLRYLNGQQLEGENGKKQRLIAEFAIENAQVVRRRQQLEEKSAQKPDGQRQNGGKDGKGAPVVQAKDEPAKAQKGKKAGKSKKTDSNEQQGGGSKSKNSRKSKVAAAADVSSDEEGAKNKREDIQQKLIARKRLVRKKKAHMRAGK